MRILARQIDLLPVNLDVQRDITHGARAPADADAPLKPAPGSTSIAGNGPLPGGFASQP